MAKKIDPDLLALIGDLAPEAYPILADQLEEWTRQIRLIAGCKPPVSFEVQSQRIQMPGQSPNHHLN